MAVSNQTGVQPDQNTFNGTRKLVRPQLPAQDRRRSDPFDDPLSHANLTDHRGTPESSHAEVFYFQKQMQQQTEMIVVLEDGEELCGIIQWYDRSVIKMRVGRRRVMIYKSSIKYLYKSSDALQGQSIMK